MRVELFSISLFAISFEYSDEKDKPIENHSCGKEQNGQMAGGAVGQGPFDHI